MNIKKIYTSYNKAIEDLSNNTSIMIGGFGVQGGQPTNLMIALRDLGIKNLTLIGNVAGISMITGYGWKDSDKDKIIDQSIFFKNSPLHDGAIIIQDNYITAARCVFPLSSKQLPARFGLRHRAAIGITERTDCLCLAVSEETGELSYIKDGEFVLYKNTEDLLEKIKSELV